MNLFTELDSRLAAMRGLIAGVSASESAGVSAVEELSEAVSRLDDNSLYELAALASAAGQLLERVSLVTSGVIGARSGRAAGHAGFAQSRGHRSPVALIQHLSGVSRAEAMRQMRVGGALIEADQLVTVGQGGVSGEGGANGEGGVAGSAASGDLSGADGLRLDDAVATGAGPELPFVPLPPWHAPLRDALMRGRLRAAQHDAVRQGLGEPPIPSAGNGGLSSAAHTASHFSLGADIPSTSVASAANSDIVAVRAAWSLAAERLIEESAVLPVEELAKQARAIRDLLDPEGARVRFDARYEARSFKMWTGRDGLTHGKFVFDDESAAWLRAIIDAALRPRRGGPRFVSVAEQAAAKQLLDDPRTNEQLTHDLLLDVLKAGSVAEAATVFGARQPGVRMVQVSTMQANATQVDTTQVGTKHANTTQMGTKHANTTQSVEAHSEVGTRRESAIVRLVDGGDTLPVSLAAKQRCNSGEVPVTVDTAGIPLNVGREQRLYTSRQRITLAVRDGGCRWNGCDRPASYCEAHHIDQWHADQGHTDIDRGILLCRFHHMQLHHGGWKITREKQGPFMLHPPPRLTPTLTHADSHTASSAASRANARSIGPPGGPIGDISGGKPLDKTEGEAAGTIRGEGPEATRCVTVDNVTADSVGNTGRMAYRVVGDGPEADRTAPIELRPPLPLIYAWQRATPPAMRFRQAA
ncbi:MAG: DUF222 domain-containing protein [Leucobacter sp.]|nr:DUF222 domain-containing protein [Leucobacter sp.]